LIKVQQVFNHDYIDDIDVHLQNELEMWSSAGFDFTGKEIAITAGSRGIADIRKILTSLISFLKSREAKPFLVPAMGSHGGATDKGQAKILDKFGITEKTMGVPIYSSMEVVELGKTTTGVPVYCDKHAASAQGIIVVNRIKDHTDYESRHESGLVKMLVIGLGKHKGALTIHRHGIKGLKEEIPRYAEVTLNTLPVLFGVGIVENAYGRTAALKVINGSEILEKETELLAVAKDLRPKILVEELDVLVVQEMGKDISGTCMDANVIGRRLIFGELEPESPRYKRVVVLSLTENSGGNAVGIGLADICTRRLMDSIDYNATYINTITATSIERVKIPLTADTDKDAIDIALNTCWVADQQKARMAIIKNTKELETVWFTETMLPRLEAREDIRVIEEPAEMQFSWKGNLIL
jgi:hypothetical protein